MLEQTDSQAAAGPCIALVTNGGAHSARRWAEVTADQLISIPPGADAKRITAASVVRNRAYLALFSAFQEVKADLSAEKLATLGEQATAAIVDGAKGSPWEENFAQATIREDIRVTITRNLFTMADIALDWE
jgi:hypothetical protein